MKSLKCHATTTLRQIRRAGPCESGWTMLVRGLGVDYHTAKFNEEPISLLRIMEINGLQDAVWALGTFPELGIDKRKFAIACVDNMPANVAIPRCVEALEAARLYVAGRLSDSALEDASLDAAHAMECARFNPTWTPTWTPSIAARWTAWHNPAYAACMASHYAANSHRDFVIGLANQAEIFAELFGNRKDGDDGR